MKITKNIISGIGSSLEWYDFALYGYMGPVLAKVFFSAQSSITSVISTYIVFAIGFLARPLGGLIFGYIGDKYGRLQALKLTPICITIATALIAITPSYKTIGFAAIVLITSLRFIQGIFLGGEYAGNIVHLCETSNKRTYFFGSIGSSAASFGIILASFVCYLLYKIFDIDCLINYGWRIGFLLSLPIGIFLYLFRLNMIKEGSIDLWSKTDTDTNKNSNPLKTVFSSHRYLILQCLGLSMHHAVSFYFVFIFIPTLLTNFRQLPESAMLLNNTWFLLFHVILIPLFGYIVNKIGGKKSLIFSCIIFILLTQPLYFLILHGNQNSIILTLNILSIMTAINAAIIPGLLSETIPPLIRYTLLAFTLNISFGILGGLTPVICLYFNNQHSNVISPPNFLILFSLITLLFAFSIKKRV